MARPALVRMGEEEFTAYLEWVREHGGDLTQDAEGTYTARYPDVRLMLSDGTYLGPQPSEYGRTTFIGPGRHDQVIVTEVQVRVEVEGHEHWVTRFVRGLPTALYSGDSFEVRL